MQEEQVSVLRVVALFVAKVFLIVIALLLVAGLIIKAVGPLGPSRTQIRDWYDLDAVRNNLGGNYILMNDLNSTTAGYEELASPIANGGKGWQPIGWEPIGTPLHPFTGSFDGQGYEIHDLFINRPDDSRVGLFREVTQRGVIKDVGVVNASVTGNDYVGGLVGYNGGTVSNSSSSGSVTGKEDVGGLLGWNGGTVSKSYSAGTVTGNSAVGGLVGWSGGGTVSNSYSTGSVTGDKYVGGLVGYNGGTVTKSYSTGSVTGKEYVGGLAGEVAEDPMVHALLNACFWDVETSGQSTSAGAAQDRTTTQMKDIATFSSWGWNITAVAPNQTDPAYIWNIVNGLTYPFLSWQS
jgi:hypothetical protein